MRKAASLMLALAIFLSVTACGGTEEITVKWEIPENDQRRFDAVLTFVENVLTYGRDPVDNKEGGRTPLFCNAINVDTLELFRWVSDNGKDTTLFSNMVSQQNLFRVLDAMTNITHDKKYITAATDAIKYMYENHTGQNGLLHWGGHVYIDLEKNESVAPPGENKQLELKFSLPYYELMYKVNKEKTRTQMEGLWSVCIRRWDKLKFNRHGVYNRMVPDVWKNNKVEDFPVLYATRNLTFSNTGADLIASAGIAYKLTGDKNALEWSKAMLNQYVKARNPKTGLESYQYTFYYEPPVNDDPWHSDRGYLQFGKDFGKSAAEPFMINSGVYGEAMLTRLYIYDLVGEKAGKVFLDTTRDAYLAYEQYAYDYNTQRFKNVFTDGTDYTGYVLPNDGYYGNKGKKYDGYADNGSALLGVLRTYTRCGDKSPIKFAKSIADGAGLGDIENTSKLNFETKSYNSYHLYSMLELFYNTNDKAYLDMARKIGDNIVAERFHNGYFTQGKDYPMAAFDSEAPLALLALHSAVIGIDRENVPEYYGSNGYAEADTMFPDGTVARTNENKLYATKRGGGYYW